MPARRPRITRRHVIAGFFLLVGALLVAGYTPLLAMEKPLITRLLFGLRGWVLPVPTAPALLVMGVIFLAAGALGFTTRFPRATSSLLWISGALLIPAVLIAALGGKQTNVVTMVASSLRLATPIALGALAGIYAERAGVVNIAIEGMMLLGAAAGFVTFVFSGNIVFGVAMALLIGIAAALLHGLLSISFKTDQIISGTVINILAFGITGYVRRTFLVDLGGGHVTLQPLKIPLLGDIPILGDLLFTQKPIFYTMIMLVIITHIVLFYTRWGLRMRAVGENPRAADTVGIHVNRTRYLNVVISGLIAGLAGAWFSLETVGAFEDYMTNGKGFIALAAMIFGNWTPSGAFGGALLFGFAEELGARFQILNVAIFGNPIPIQFMQILPYVTTMIVLAGLIGRASPPAAVGKPYEK